MGTHNATIPNFLQSTCLRKISAGEIEYDFGPESSFQTLTDLPEFIAPPARNKRPRQYTSKWKTAETHTCVHTKAVNSTNFKETK
ncbi:hypothetical protein DPMN_154108 [Dreissena polymorpha]|uniref:Uncharacterized protein n=1 Tax=Dreissena polymorpha TaxID=45954 RepID=A0A9D4FQ51_DREPO|nr:hypothetical protein DPMN_154108 [Dreissena polymorpha]